MLTEQNKKDMAVLNAAQSILDAADHWYDFTYEANTKVLRRTIERYRLAKQAASIPTADTKPTAEG